jgi:hypothetical protein
LTIRAAVSDPEGRLVELTHERWRHITRGHPEIQELGDVVLEAVQNPHHAVPGRQANERWYYAKTEGPSAWLKVVVAYVGGVATS